MRLLTPLAACAMTALTVTTLLACNPTQPQTAGGAVSNPEDAKPVVVIDGRSVTRGEYEDALYKRFAENHLETFVEDELVAATAKKKNIVADQKKIDAKVKKDVDALLKTRFNGNEAALAKALGERGMSLGGWKADLTARASREQILEQLIKAGRTAEATVVIRKFEQKYGEEGKKYRVRHILVSTKVVNSRFYPKSEYEAEKPKIDAELAGAANKLHADIKGGGDFAKLAKEHSDDFTASRGGDLGESWTGRFGRAFDDAVGRLKVGALSKPIKSKRGLHIIEVTALRPGVQYRGKAILVSTGANGPADRRSPEDRTKGADKKVADIKAALAGGKSFEDVARDFSDDLATKARGGELGVFGRRRLGDEVANVLDKTKPGATTEAIKSKRGYWIVQLQDRKLVPKDDKKAVRHIFLSAEYDKVKKRKLGPDLERLAKEKATALQARITGGADFGEVAEKESEDAYTRKTGGEYLNFRKTSLGSEVWEAVQKAAPGAALSIVQSKRGFHIVNVIEKKETKFDAVKAELLKDLNDQPITPSESRAFMDAIKAEAKVERKIGASKIAVGAPGASPASKPAGEPGAETPGPGVKPAVKASAKPAPKTGAAPAKAPAAAPKKKVTPDKP